MFEEDLTCPFFRLKRRNNTLAELRNALGETERLDDSTCSFKQAAVAQYMLDKYPTDKRKAIAINVIETRRF